MGFYGKIYEQMGDVFNRAKFINAEPNTFNFNSKTEDVIINAEAHGDRLPIVAGNSWIVFEPGFDKENNPACVIYHSAPQEQAVGNPDVASSSIIGQVIRTPGDSDYLTLTNPSSTLLTPEEKQKLLDTENLLYFGDKILLFSPIRDEAGHIIEFKEKQWQLGSIPRLADILGAENRVSNMENIVGTTNYPLETKGNMSTRIEALETNFDEVHTTANEASQLATSANNFALAAEESAKLAENSAERAAQSALNTSNEVTVFKEETITTLGRYDARIRGNTNAIGAGDSDTIKIELDTNSLLEWAQIIIGIIGDEYNAIRDGNADTITDQIHNNDDNIAQLRVDLTKEIDNCAIDIDAEETARKAEITRLEGIISTNKEASNTALEEEAIARAAAIEAEANLRVAKDNELANEIGKLADLISDLSALVEAQQTTISELQEKIAVLEGYHTEALPTE